MDVRPLLQQLLSCLAVAALLLMHSTVTTTTLMDNHPISLYPDGASSPLLSLQEPGPRSRRRVRNKHYKKAEKGFEKQMALLSNLRCKPKRVKIPVLQFIGGDNEILDLNPHPEVMVVKRCENLCSYCGNRLGFEHLKCKPKTVKHKTFYIFYNSGRGQGIHKLRVPVHKRCECR